MALINCRKCGVQGSSKSAACFYCGYPVNEVHQEETVSKSMPALPLLKYFNGQPIIGDELFSWNGASRLSGKALQDVIASGRCPAGSLSISRCKHGLSLYGYKSKGTFQIHYSQIQSIGIDVGGATRRSEKSVVGRALLGGVFLGPVGAIVGGISGVGQKISSSDVVFINYWDLDSQCYEAISLTVGGGNAVAFCELVNQSISEYSGIHKGFN